MVASPCKKRHKVLEVPYARELEGQANANGYALYLNPCACMSGCQHNGDEHLSDFGFKMCFTLEDGEVMSWTMSKMSPIFQPDTVAVGNA